MDTAGGPRIVWPAPGSPALLEGDERRFDLIVTHAVEGIAALSAWAQRLALRQRRARVRAPLALERVEPIRRSEVGAKAAGFAALPAARQLHFARLRVRAPDALGPRSPRSVTVYDIVDLAGTARQNAVAVLTAGEVLNLAFASDVHIAAAWDAIAEAVQRHAPDLVPCLLHPSQLLAGFVEEINRLAAGGGVDLVVLGGDLVDHVYVDHRGAAAGLEGTNVARFERLLAEIEVPVIALPGNHDYRLFPWRPRVPGFDAVGIPAARQGPLLRAAGLWDPWPFRLSDRRALQTEEGDGYAPLMHHLSRIAPATDFDLRVRRLRLVCLSTGRDVLPRWREVEPPRRRLLLRSIPTSWHDPDCEGLTGDQVRLLTESLGKSHGAAVFLHAPLLHARPGMRFADGIGELDPGDRDDLASQVTFERRLFATGLRCGVLFRNVAAVARALAMAPAEVTVFSGHVHHASALALGKQSQSLRLSALRLPLETRPEAATVLLTAPALGHVRRPGGEMPGYLMARFRQGSLTAVEERTLLPAPPN
jgi:hypothetical protein